MFANFILKNSKCTLTLFLNLFCTNQINVYFCGVNKNIKNMDLTEFTKQAQEITPLDWSCYSRIEQIRYRVNLGAMTKWSVSVLKDDTCQIFQSESPETTLNQLKSYFNKK